MLTLIAQEWIETGLRWLHVAAAIFWIGLALAFLRINLNLRARAEIWRAGDDGFFRIEKKAAPVEGAEVEVGWFRWEAYTVWLSGAALMIARTFVNADLYLIDPAVAPLTQWQAIGIAVGAITIAWLVYDFLCKAKIGLDETARRAASFVFFVALMFGLTRAFSGAGALIVFGAALGTIMIANVAHVLVPNQRRLLAAVRAGEAPDAARMAASRQRALHNNYLMPPVLFLMLSNHFPLVSGGRFVWLSAALVLVAGAAIRHFFVVRHREGRNAWWTFALAALAGAAVVLLSAPRASDAQASAPRDASAAIARAMTPRFSDIEEIVADRCVMCHAQAPARAGLAAAPKGLLLDTPERIRVAAPEIMRQAVLTRAMPPRGSEIEMENDEREALAAWFRSGAPGR